MNRRISRIQFSVDSEIRMELERRAIKEGLSLQDWLREHLLEIGGLAALQSQQNQNMNQTMMQLTSQILALQMQKQESDLAQIVKLMELRNSNPVYKAAFDTAFGTPSKCPHCGKEL